jgi:putative transposase
MARAALRQMAMELLYKYSGMKGGEIGHMMGLDYSTVSQGRKRLRESKNLQGLMGRIEERLSRIKI